MKKVKSLYAFWKWDSLFWSGTPIFHIGGVPDSYFQNPSENPGVSDQVSNPAHETVWVNVLFSSV